MGRQAMPQINKKYKITEIKSGKEYTGTVKRIARMYTGAVLAFVDLDDGSTKSFPVSKHAIWNEI